MCLVCATMSSKYGSTFCLSLGEIIGNKQNLQSITLANPQIWSQPRCLKVLRKLKLVFFQIGICHMSHLQRFSILRQFIKLGHQIISRYTFSKRGQKRFKAIQKSKFEYNYKIQTLIHMLVTFGVLIIIMSNVMVDTVKLFKMLALKEKEAQHDSIP